MLHSSIVVVLALSAGLAQGADKKVIQPKGATPNAGWSHGLLVDGTLYVSGMVVAKLVGAGHIEITATARK